MADGQAGYTGVVYSEYEAGYTSAEGYTGVVRGTTASGYTGATSTPSSPPGRSEADPIPAISDPLVVPTGAGESGSGSIELGGLPIIDNPSGYGGVVSNPPDSGVLGRDSEEAILDVSESGVEQQSSYDVVIAPDVSESDVEQQSGYDVDIAPDVVTAPEEPTRAGFGDVRLVEARLEEERRRATNTFPFGLNQAWMQDYVDNQVEAVGVNLLQQLVYLTISNRDEPITVPLSEFTDEPVSLVPVLPPAESLQAALAQMNARLPAGLSEALAQRGMRASVFYRGPGGLYWPSVLNEQTLPRIVPTLNRAIESARAGLAATETTFGDLLLWYIGARFPIRVREGAVPATGIQRLRPVNGRINVGGGLEPGTEIATNLNPIVPGTGGPTTGIPNWVRGGFEQIGELFEQGSAVVVYSRRLPFGTVNWSQAASGTFRVLRSGGRLELNVWTRSAEEVQQVIEAFTRAGFRNVSNASGYVGPGTVITGIRP